VEQISEQQTLLRVPRHLPVILAVMSAWMEVQLDVSVVHREGNSMRENVSLLVLQGLTLTLILAKVRF